MSLCPLGANSGCQGQCWSLVHTHHHQPHHHKHTHHHRHHHHIHQHHHCSLQHHVGHQAITHVFQWLSLPSLGYPWIFSRYSHKTNFNSNSKVRWKKGHFHKHNIKCHIHDTPRIPVTEHFKVNFLLCNTATVART